MLSYYSHTDTDPEQTVREAALRDYSALERLQFQPPQVTGERPDRYLIPIRLSGRPLLLQTPILRVSYLDQEADLIMPGTRRLCLRLPPLPTASSPVIRSAPGNFTRNIDLLDGYVVQKITECAEEWFGSSARVSKDDYRPSLSRRRSGRTDIPFDPVLRPRIGTLSTGEQTLGFTDQTQLDHLSSVRCVLGLQGVWVEKGGLRHRFTFGCTWDVVHLEVIEPTYLYMNPRIPLGNED